MTNKLYDTDFQIQFKSGLSSNIAAKGTILTAVEGEPHWTTDTNDLLIFDGNNLLRVHGLDMALVNNGDVVTHNGEIVWLT